MSDEAVSDQAVSREAVGEKAVADEVTAAPRRVLVGVDTGGTYTDAVVYDDATATVVATAKSPTTHDDLSIGIAGAFDAAVAAAGVDPAAVAMVSLSTTLATNALVEGLGRPAALVLIGFEPGTLDRAGLRDAVAGDPVITLAGGHDTHGRPQADLDVDGLAAALDALDPEIEAVAVTAQFAVRNPEHELTARELVRERTGLPVTCSHELSDGLNGPKRAVTALLNARLISLVEQLLATTEATLADRGVDAPVMVVRGNGSLVSSRFVQERPVETILSGPAASLVGAAHLAGLDDAVIADIGGTTTDIAVLHGGLPEFGADGAVVGGHRTMVEAVRMHTHGLGGDSEIALADRAVGAQVTVGPRRVVPVVVAAAEAPEEIAAALDRQRRADTPPSTWSGMFARATARLAGARLDGVEQRVVDGLGPGWTAADTLAGTARHAGALRRLVDRGLVRLAGFTPTDAAHVLGRQATHDPGPAREAAALFAARRDRYGNPVAASADELAHAVIEALVRRSGEALLGAAFDRDGLPAEAVASPLAAAALDRRGGTARLDVGLAVALVGLGAPAATYYPAIGGLLGAEVVIPDHADVANAVGAVVGRVRIRRQVTVTAPRRGTFRVHAAGGVETLHDHAAARDRALAAATDVVAAEMVEAGAPEFDLETHWHEKSAEIEGRELFVEGTATVIGVGRPDLGPAHR